MESRAYIKYIHVSPKKLRFIIADVKKKTPRQALDHLYTSQKRNAKILYKALKSAIDNAKLVLKVADSELSFKTFLVEEGPSLKRMRPGSKGMAKMYQRRTSHIKVILIANTVSPIVKPKEVVKKIEKKVTVPPIEQVATQEEKKELPVIKLAKKPKKKIVSK